MDLVVKIRTARNEGKILPSTAKNIEEWLKGMFLPHWALEAIQELIDAEQWEELNDRFYQNLEFGTGGMRSRTIGKFQPKAEQGRVSFDGAPEHPAVGTNYLNDFNVIRATMGLFHYCENYLQANGSVYETPKLVIAHDVRYFSRHFCELAASTWSRMGGTVYIFDGPRSTPQLSFTVRHIKATAGIVITASHNPSHDNGYKVYFQDGAQVVSPHDVGIIKAVNRIEYKDIVPHLEVHLANVTTLSPLLDEAYLNAIESAVLDSELLRTQKTKIVYSSLHGTGGIQAVPLMQNFNVDVTLVGTQMHLDPRFPTVKSPNPENPEALAMAIEQANQCEADAVLATDPDGDRMGAAVRNKQGQMEIITGNMIGSMLAEYRISKMIERGWIPSKGSNYVAIIKTFVTTPMLDEIATRYNIKVINTLTGFKWIGEKIANYEEELKRNMTKAEGLAIDYDKTSLKKRAELLQRYSTFYLFGSEESYGYLPYDTVRDKDANAAVICFCELAAYVKKLGLTFPEYLDSLYAKYGYFKEDLVNIYYEGAAGSAKIKNILADYRANPPSEINGIRVSRFVDFGREKLFDADEKLIPPQDFYMVHLENGYSFSIRGSGTEPKIKFYLSAKEHVFEKDQLPEAKAEAQRKLQSLGDFIKSDASRRSEIKY